MHCKRDVTYTRSGLKSELRWSSSSARESFATRYLPARLLLRCVVLTKEKIQRPDDWLPGFYSDDITLMDMDILERPSLTGFNMLIFLRGVNPLTNSLNCTCQQISVNRLDQRNKSVKQDALHSCYAV